MSVSGVGSGGPSAAQLLQFQQQLFKKADGDQNGSLSVDEFTGLKGPEGDGAVKGPSAAEKAELFKSLDADGDGALTSTEFQAGKPPSPPGSQFDSASLGALIDIQGQEAEDGSTSSLVDLLLAGLYDRSASTTTSDTTTTSARYDTAA